MSDTTVTFDDVEVVAASDLAMRVQVQGKVIVVGSTQPLAGTTIRWLGERGSLVLPRWAVRELGLSEPAPRASALMTRHLAPDRSSESLSNTRADRRFVVSCLHCKRIIVVTGRIADAELNQLRAHLLACCPDEVFGASAGIAATLERFRVMPTDSDPPPDAA